MGVITIESKYGPIDIKISGDEPTFEESNQIEKISARPESFLPKEIISERSAQSGGGNIFDSNFDTTTGVQDTALRADLSRADRLSEKIKVLQGNGLSSEDYTQDNRGQLALTPSGAKKFGIETDKNIVIDESGFTKSDIVDLAGIAPEITGAIGGALVGQAVIPIPVVGAMLGAAFLGGSGSLLEEFYEISKGFSDQTPEEIAKQTGKEALIAGAFEGAGQAVFKILGKVFGGPTASKLPQSERDAIMKSIDMGIDPSLDQMGGNALLARQQAMSENILKSSPRLVKNNAAINRKIDELYSKAGVGVGNSDDLGAALKQASEDGNTALLTQARDASNDVIKHMTDLSDEVGRAAIKDVQINDDIFSALTQSFKHFDDIQNSYYKQIDDITATALGQKEIIPIGNLNNLLSRDVAGYKYLVGKTSQNLEKDIIDTFSAEGIEGSKASFEQLYRARKSLSDIRMQNGGESGINRMTTKYIDEIDGILSASNLSDLTVIPIQQFSGLGKGSRNTLLAATKSIKEAREQFSKGMAQFDSLRATTIYKDIAAKVRNDIEVDPSEIMEQLIKSNSPQQNLSRLNSLKQVFDGAAKRAGTTSLYEPFKKRMAGEWIRTNLEKSIKANAPEKFSGKTFAQAYDKLGKSADEFFGADAQAVKKLSEQMDALSLTDLNQSVIDDVIAKAGVNSAGINLLKNVIGKQKELTTFNKNSVMKKLRDGNLEESEAALVLANPNTSAQDMSKVMTLLSKQKSGSNKSLEDVQRFYMDNIVGDFPDNFLTDPKQFRLFADRLLKDSDEAVVAGSTVKFGKLEIIYGKEMAESMRDFGEVLKLNSKSADAGKLVAAGIAASPLQNLDRIAKFFVLGKMFSLPTFYSNFVKAYKADAKGKSGLAAENLKKQLLVRSISQTMGLLGVSATGEGIDQAKSLASNLTNDLTNEIAPKPTPTRNTPVPNVQPGALENLPYKVVPPSPLSAKTSIRQRAMGDPTIAATLLGGLGSANLLNRP